MQSVYTKGSVLLTVISLVVVVLALILGEQVAEGWQINVASRARDGFWTLAIMDLDRGLTYDVPLAQEIRSPPLFSPNGRYAVFDNGTINTLFDLQEQESLMTPSGVARMWSPDSRYLAFVDNESDSASFQAILIVEIDENGTPSEPRPVTLENGDPLPGYMLWSPDSEQLAFLAYNTVSSDLLLADADGRNARRLVPTHQTIQTMAWSPDSEQVAFVWYRFDELSQFQLSRVNVDGSGQAIIAEDIAGNIGALSWSPDGRFIAYISMPAQGLFVIDIETGQITGPIDYQLAGTIFDWSPDGERLVFLSARDSDFYVVGRDGRNIRRLTDNDNLNILMP